MVTEVVGGGLLTNFSYVEKGECSEMLIPLDPTEVPGQLQPMSSRWVREIEELPVKDHYTFYCEGYCGWRTFRVAKLVGRNLEVDLEALEEFKKFAQRKGFLLKNIFIPVQTGNGAVVPRSPGEKL
nr:odorant-binding protein 2b-like [Dasypus novemcinctus]